MADKYSELLLGKDVGSPQSYTPEILAPIARSPGRAELPAEALGKCSGVDIWHAYELSWLASNGVPQMRVGRITIPSSSPNMVESKSLKLYLNSLNNSRFDSANAVCEVIERDLSQVAGAAVQLLLLDVDALAPQASAQAAICIDTMQPAHIAATPDASVLGANYSRSVERHCLYSHLMRSLCPVTGQPDWATLWLRYSGPELDQASLLGYLLSYRNHQEFHEQCIERIFCDVYSACAPSQLEVQGSYLRRGGLDINPYRSTESASEPWARMVRQ